MWRAIKTHACFDYLLKTSVTEQNINDVLDSALKRLHKYDGTLDFIAGKRIFPELFAAAVSFFPKINIRFLPFLITNSSNAALLFFYCRTAS